MDSEILSITEELMKTREEYSKASAEKSRLEDQKKKLEYRLYNLMEDQDITRFVHEKFGTIYRSHRVWCRVTDFEKACRFLREKGVYDEVMRLEARSGRLNELIKAEYLDVDGVIPETDIGISATITPMIGNRASTKGGDFTQ